MDGIEILSNMYNTYDAENRSYDIGNMAVRNGFVELMEKVAGQMGNVLRPFCFFQNDIQKQWQVMDFSAGSGLCNMGYNLMQEIRNFHILNLMATQNMLGDYPQITDKTVFIDYLLSVSVCYIEIPKYIKRGDSMAKSYDKFIATKNMDLMADWVGKNTFEIEGKYSVGSDAFDLVQNTVRLIKLTTKQNENRLSKPRDAVYTGDMSVLPLFMVNAFMDGVHEKLKSGIVRFVYAKDNGVVRELVSTCNRELLEKVYKESGFVDKMLSPVLNDDGTLCRKQDRGYVRLPEFGSSMYDETGVRAVNINRILACNEMAVTDVDLSYINVDLDGVLDAFKEGLQRVYGSSPQEMKQFYMEVLGEEPADFGIETYLKCYEGIVQYVDTVSIAMTTQFNKALHKFMITHPQWYPYYTGMGKTVKKSYANNDFGVM